jgi:hypothetical protein
MIAGPYSGFLDKGGGEMSARRFNPHTRECSDEAVEAVIEFCRIAGVQFDLRRGSLIVSFNGVQWHLWPDVKKAIEFVGDKRLRAHVQTHAHSALVNRFYHVKPASIGQRI